MSQTYPIRKHDADCPACAYESRPEYPLMDYATWCSSCGRDGIQGCTEHKIDGKPYCAVCARKMSREIQ